MKAVKIPTIYNVADLLTKCHSKGSMMKLMGLVNIRAVGIAARETDWTVWGISD